MKSLRNGTDGIIGMALMAIMSAVFILGTGGTARSQDAGGDAAPAYAYIMWGAQTDGDSCALGDNPKWLLGAYKAGAGEWETNPPAWHVSAVESNFASLNLDVERGLLNAGAAAYWVHYFDFRGGSLYLDLLSTNGTPVQTDLVGNLMKGSNVEAVVCLDIPLPKEAAVIQLRRGSGEIRVYESLITFDESGHAAKGQARATYYYPGSGEPAAKGPVLGAKAKGGGAIDLQAANDRKVRRNSLAGTRKDTVGAVNLKVFTHLE